jgi:hypothetical protein
VVTKLDRLDRSQEHLIELSNALAARDLDLVVSATRASTLARAGHHLARNLRILKIRTVSSLRISRRVAV